MNDNVNQAIGTIMCDMILKQQRTSLLPGDLYSHGMIVISNQNDVIKLLKDGLIISIPASLLKNWKTF